MADQQNEEEFYDFEEKTETQLETSEEHSGEGKKGNEEEEKISRSSWGEPRRLQDKHPKDGFNKVVGARNDRNNLQKSLRDKQKELIGLNGLKEKARDESTKRLRQKEKKDSKDEKSRMETSKEHSEGSSHVKGDGKDSSLMKKRQKVSRRLRERNPKELVTIVSGSQDERERLAKINQEEKSRPNESVKQLKKENAKLKKQLNGITGMMNENTKLQKRLKDKSNEVNKLKKELERCRKELESSSTVSLTENTKLQRQIEECKEEIAKLQQRDTDKEIEGTKLREELTGCKEELESRRIVPLTENTELQRQIKECKEEIAKLQQTIKDKEEENIKLRGESARYQEELGRRRIAVSLTDLLKPEPPKEGTPHKSNPARHRRLKTTPPRFVQPQNFQTKDSSSIRSSHNITADPQTFSQSDDRTAETIFTPTRGLENGAVAFLPVKNLSDDRTSEMVLTPTSALENGAAAFASVKNLSDDRTAEMVLTPTRALENGEAAFPPAKNVVRYEHNDALTASRQGGDVVAESGKNPHLLTTNGACGFDKDWSSPERRRGDPHGSNLKTKRSLGLKGAQRDYFPSGHSTQRDLTEDDFESIHIGMHPCFLARHSAVYWDSYGPVNYLEVPSGIHSVHHRSKSVPERNYLPLSSSSTFPECPDLTKCSTGDHSTLNNPIGSPPQKILSPDGYQRQESSLNLFLMPKTVPAKTSKLLPSSSVR